MFSQVSVKNSVHGGGCLPRQTPPPSGQTHAPPGTATAADGTHPTGMHSCLHHMMLVNLKLNVSGYKRVILQGCRLFWSNSFLMAQLK